MAAEFAGEVGTLLLLAAFVLAGAFPLGCAGTPGEACGWVPLDAGCTNWPRMAPGCTFGASWAKAQVASNAGSTAFKSVRENFASRIVNRLNSA
jgi:hypothetical protein